MRRGGNTHPKEGVRFNWNIPAKAKLRINVKNRSWSPATDCQCRLLNSLTPKAAKTRGDSSMDQILSHPLEQSSRWAEHVISSPFCSRPLRRSAATGRSCWSHQLQQVVPKASPRALQAATHLSSHVRPFLLMQTCFSTPGDRCCRRGRTRHRAGSCRLYPQLLQHRPWAALGGDPPPQVCARS